MKMNINTGLLLVLAAVTMVMECAYGLSPTCNAPRPGDRITKFVVENVMTTPADTPDYVDLSESRTVGRSTFAVYNPAQEDTLSAMMITDAGRTTRLIRSDHQLYEYSYYQPGETRRYTAQVPYGVCADSMMHHAAGSEGALASIGDFVTEGNRRMTLDGNHTLITMTADTIRSAECLSVFTDEHFHYAGGDTVRHVGVLRQWYAPGYRYPVAEYSDDIMITLDGDTIDQVNRWRATDLHQQQENVKDDPTNELIREYVYHPEYRPDYTVRHEPGSGDGTSGNGSITWNPESETVTFAPDYDGDTATSEYVVCNDAGVVFATGTVGRTTGLIISLRGYSDGTYIIALKTGDSYESIKVRKL